MQLKEALAQGIVLLEKSGVDSSRLTTEVLLMHAVRCDRAHLYAHAERQLTDSEWVHYGRYLNERLQGKPTQYITGHQEFWAMDFLVNPSVLIPRPETELVVEAALDVARRNFPSGGTCRIADVGTGSGCIAVALARELPQAHIYALDQSPAALETACRNAVKLGVADRITFLLSDLLHESAGEENAADEAQRGSIVGESEYGPLPSGRGSVLARWPDDGLRDLHMVVSNPPYVAERDRHTLTREVLEFEPSEALFAGESGMDAYTKLIPQAAEALQAHGYLVLELGYDSEEGVRKLLESPTWDEVRWRHDLAGIVRVVTARRA